MNIYVGTYYVIRIRLISLHFKWHFAVVFFVSSLIQDTYLGLPYNPTFSRLAIFSPLQPLACFPQVYVWNISKKEKKTTIEYLLYTLYLFHLRMNWVIFFFFSFKPIPLAGFCWHLFASNVAFSLQKKIHSKLISDFEKNFLIRYLFFLGFIELTFSFFFTIRQLAINSVN